MMSFDPWQPISTAPRDGTIIGIKCSYGLDAWYGRHFWDKENMAWRNKDKPDHFIAPEAENRCEWRPL